MPAKLLSILKLTLFINYWLTTAMGSNLEHHPRNRFECAVWHHKWPRSKARGGDPFCAKVEASQNAAEGEAGIIKGHAGVPGAGSPSGEPAARLRSAGDPSIGASASRHGLSLLKMDTVTCHVPSAWRLKTLTNLPCSLGFVPVMAKVPT